MNVGMNIWNERLNKINNRIEYMALFYFQADL